MDAVGLSDTIKEEEEEVEVKRPFCPSIPIPPYETPGPGPSDDFTTSYGLGENPESLNESATTFDHTKMVTSADELLMDLFEQHPSIMKSVYDETPKASDGTSAPVPADKTRSVAGDETTESETKVVEDINEYMESYKTIEEKLTAVCQKYLGAINDKRHVESEASRVSRENTMLKCQKEQLLTKYDRLVRVRDRMKIVCQSLQLQIKSLKEETVLKLSEEHEKCMSLIARIKSESPVGDDTKVRLQKLEQANGELAARCGRMSEENETQRKQISKMELRIRLEAQLNMAKRKKMELEMDAEREHMSHDNERMFKELKMAELKIKDLSKEIVGKMKSVDHHENCIAQVNHLREENTKLREKLSRLESDAVSWNTLWNKSQKTLVEMKTKRYKERDEAHRREGQLKMVQDVCRSLQAERFRLLDKIRKIGVGGGHIPMGLSRDLEETRVMKNEVFRNPFSVNTGSVYETNATKRGDANQHSTEKTDRLLIEKHPERIGYIPHTFPEKCVDKDMNPWPNFENSTRMENKVLGIAEATSAIPPQSNLKDDVNINLLSKSVENFMKTLISNGFTLDKSPVKNHLKSFESLAVYNVVDVDIPPPLIKKLPVRNVRKNGVFNVKEKYSAHKHKCGRIGDTKQHCEKTVKQIEGTSSEDRIRKHIQGLSICSVNDFDIPPVIISETKTNCVTVNSTIDKSSMNNVTKVQTENVNAMGKLSLSQSEGKCKEQESRPRENVPHKISTESNKVPARHVRSLNTPSTKEELKSKGAPPSSSAMSAIEKAKLTEDKLLKRHGCGYTNQPMAITNGVNSLNEVTSKISVKALVDNFNNINKIPVKPSFRTLVDRNDAFSSDGSESSCNSLLNVGDYVKLADSENSRKSSCKVVSKNADSTDEVEESKSLKELASLVQSLFNFSKQIKSEGQTIHNVLKMGVLPKEYDVIRNISSSTFKEIKKEANNIAQILRLDEMKNERTSVSGKAVERLDRLTQASVEKAKEEEALKKEVKMVESLKKEMREEMGKLMKEKMNTFPVISKWNNVVIYTTSDILKTRVQWLQIERLVNGYQDDSDVSKDTAYSRGGSRISERNMSQERRSVGGIGERCNGGEVRRGDHDVCPTLRHEQRSPALQESEKRCGGGREEKSCNIQLGPVNVDKCYERHVKETNLFPVVKEQCFKFLNEENTRITKGKIEWLPIMTYISHDVVAPKMVTDLPIKTDSLERYENRNLSLISQPYKSENLFFIKHSSGNELDNVTRKNSTHREWLLIEKPLPFDAASNNRVSQVEQACDKVLAGQLEWLSVEEHSTGVIAKRDLCNDVKLTDQEKREWFVVDRSSVQQQLDDHIDKFCSKMAIGHIKWLPIKDSSGCLDSLQDVCSSLQVGQRQWCLLERTVSKDGEGNTTFVEEQQWFLYDKTLAGNKKNCAVGQIEWHSLTNPFNNNRVLPVDHSVHEMYGNVIKELLEKHSEVSLRGTKEYMNHPERDATYEQRNDQKPVDVMVLDQDTGGTGRKTIYNLPNHYLFPDQGLGVKNPQLLREQPRESSPVTYPRGRPTVSSASREILTEYENVPEKLPSEGHRRETDARRGRTANSKDRTYDSNDSPTRSRARAAHQGRLPSVSSESRSGKKDSSPKPKTKLSSFMHKLF